VNIAVLSESSADEAAVRTLLAPLTPPAGAIEQLPQLRSRGGWTNVLSTLPGIVKALHYHSAADALVVVLDSDDTTPHGLHDENGPAGCRLCAVSSLLARELAALRDVPGRDRLKTAVGLAMPAIEAWYLCGVNATVTEAAWINGLANGQPPYNRDQLKRWVYGTPIPLLDRQRDMAVAQATRLSADLPLLDKWFPQGCGTMLDAVRGW